MFKTIDIDIEDPYESINVNCYYKGGYYWYTFWEGK